MLRELGFSLDSIKGFLNTDNHNTARQYFERRQMEIEEELQAIQHKKEMIRLILEDMEKNNGIDWFNAVEKDIPRRTGPTSIKFRKILFPVLTLTLCESLR
jgi:DNA-binding transcriptional MerR regulator